MDALSREQLKIYLEENNKPIVSNYKYIEIVNDTQHSNYYFLRELYGFETSISSETWRHYHFPVSSPNHIILSSYHEGRNTLMLAREGEGEVNLVPSYHPIAIESIKRNDLKVRIVYTGYAGGGLSASIGRGLADGIETIELIQQGGGKKLGKGAIVLPLRKFLIFGVDDTDNAEEGATYDLVREASLLLTKEFSDVTITNVSECNLYPVKEKTSNCFATAVGLSYEVSDGKKEKIINKFIETILSKAVSKQTAILVHDGFIISGEIEKYGVAAKTGVIESIDTPYELINKNEIEFYSYDDKLKRGAIGALASLGLFWKFKYTAAPPTEPMPEDAKLYPEFYESNSLIV
jgi:methanogenesis imperfect marker protein 11